VGSDLGSWVDACGCVHTKERLRPTHPTPYSLLPTPYSLLPTPDPRLPTPNALKPEPRALAPLAAASRLASTRASDAGDVACAEMRVIGRRREQGGVEAGQRGIRILRSEAGRCVAESPKLGMQEARGKGLCKSLYVCQHREHGTGEHVRGDASGAWAHVCVCGHRRRARRCASGGCGCSGCVRSSSSK
jgi:hypothetical protein